MPITDNKEHVPMQDTQCGIIGRPVPVMRHLSAYEAQALSIMVSAYKKWFGGRPW